MGGKLVVLLGDGSEAVLEEIQDRGTRHAGPASA